MNTAKPDEKKAPKPRSGTPADEEKVSRPSSMNRSSSFGDDEAFGVGLPASWSLQDFQRRVRGILDSYLGSLEEEEAVDCFREFAKETCSFLDEVVVCALRVALERPAKQRELIESLLHKLHTQGVLDSPSLARGFAKLACTWEELAIDDGPEAPATLVAMLLSCIEACSVDRAFLTRLPEGLLVSASERLGKHAGKAAKKEELERVVDRLQEFKRALESARLLQPLRLASSSRLEGDAAAAHAERLRQKADRAARALRKIGMPEFHHEYVKRVLVASFDWPRAERGRDGALLALLGELFSSSVLTSEDLQWGVIRLLGQLEDLTLDCPASSRLAVVSIQGLATKTLISESFVRRCKLLRVGGAAGLAVLDQALQGPSDCLAEVAQEPGEEQEESESQEDDEEAEDDEDGPPEASDEGGSGVRGADTGTTTEQAAEQPPAISLRPGGGNASLLGSLTGAPMPSLRPGGGGGSLTGGEVSLRPERAGLRPGGDGSSGAYPVAAGSRGGGDAKAKESNAAGGRRRGGGGNKAIRKTEGESFSWRDDAANHRSSKKSSRGEKTPKSRGGGGGDAAEPGSASAPAKLEVSENSWAAQQRKRRAEASKADSAKQESLSDEEIARRMKSILNKLTMEKFDELFEQLTTCGISNAEHVDILMKEVFEKATTQHHFIEMYTMLCVSLSEWFDAHVKVGNFKKILVDQCQASFEATIQQPPELADQQRRRRKKEKDKDKDKEKDKEERRSSKLTPAEEEALEEQRLKHKMRIFGNIKFVGQLLVKKMVASKVLVGCAEELLAAEPSPGTLEPLASLLMTTGSEFDKADHKLYKPLCSVFSRVNALTKDQSLPPRTRFLLQDVIDLRESGWVDRKVVTKKLEGPKKLDEIHSG